ncbi:MAG TPA: hypothetical protein PLV68_18405, partial [Ilumatobacteraceae bacterium]|nr:hypothetical protein [Ilumatobacteraceae bacterium]
VLGEYVYAEGDGVRIVGRHERTTTTPTAFAPTSLTALSVEAGGHRLEVYADLTQLAVVIDGLLTPLSPNQVRAVGPAISITSIEPTRLTIGVDGALISMYGLLPLTGNHFTNRAQLNTEYTAAAHHRWRGLLGTNDGNQDNDLVGRDGVAITADQAWDHGAAFYGFTESWRLHDPAESPFLLPSDQFGLPNDPRPGDELLEPYRQQAVALLATLETSCAAGPDQAGTLVDQLAIELAIGAATDALIEYACSYTIAGRITVDIPDGDGSFTLPAPGAQVVVEVVGLEACSTTTNSNGDYRCTARPIAGDTIGFPADVWVGVVAPGGDEIATRVKTGTIADRAPMGTTRTSFGNDISLDGHHVRVIDVAMALQRYGQPVTGAVVMVAHHFDDGDDGDALHAVATTVPFVGGSGRLLAAVGPSVTSVDLQLVSEAAGSPMTTIVIAGGG